MRETYLGAILRGDTVKKIYLVEKEDADGRVWSTRRVVKLSRAQFERQQRVAKRKRLAQMKAEYQRQKAARGRSR